MTETYTVLADTPAMHQHLLKGVHSTLRSLLDMYPSTEWSLEESMVVRAALYEIGLWRQRGVRGDSSRRPLPTSRTGTG